MAYTRQEFALELKQKIQKQETIKFISQWALHLYRTYKNEIDFDFRDLLSDLIDMDSGPEYVFSLEELDAVADSLLDGELIIDLYDKRDLRIQLREDFGKALKDKVKQREDLYLIGQWAWFVYSDYMCEIDNDFREMLISLNALEDGPEFALSYEKLDEIADKLIAGERAIKIYRTGENQVYKNR